MRITSKERLKAASELSILITSGGDAKEFMGRFHPEDAVLINDMAFGELYNRNPMTYPVSRADADCLPFLMQCSSEFIKARKEMTQGLLRAFDNYEEEKNDI